MPQFGDNRSNYRQDPKFHSNSTDERLPSITPGGGQIIPDRNEFLSLKAYFDHAIGKLSCKQYYTTRAPIESRASVHNARAANYGYKGQLTALDLRRAFEESGGSCYWCDIDVSNELYHIDHYVPLVLGGPNIFSNLRISCQPCNSSKSAKDPLEFATQIGKSEDPAIRARILEEGGQLHENYLNRVKSFSGRIMPTRITVVYLPQADCFGFCFSKFDKRASSILSPVPFRRFLKTGAGTKAGNVGVWVVPKTSYRIALTRVQQTEIEVNFAIPLYSTQKFAIPDEPEYRSTLYHAETGKAL